MPSFVKLCVVFVLLMIFSQFSWCKNNTQDIFHTAFKFLCALGAWLSASIGICCQSVGTNQNRICQSHGQTMILKVSNISILAFIGTARGIIT